LVDGPPQITLLVVDLHEGFINEEGIALASVLPLQSAGINGPELNAPKVNFFAVGGYAAFSQ
jgi:hypothetical protein